VVEAGKNGQYVKKRLFYAHFSNGTRLITDSTERDRHQVQVWGA
jgi:hypothetical protein